MTQKTAAPIPPSTLKPAMKTDPQPHAPMRARHPHRFAAFIGLSAAFAMAAQAQTCETLINLSFSPNSGDIAAHPNVSNITPWTNGSEVTDDPFNSGIYYMPDDDFGNGYAGLTTPSPRFGWQWGFEGGFDMTSTNPWQVCRVSFDYDVLGHNGEASLALMLGPWTGTAPLPSTGSDWDLPTDTWLPSSPGQRSYGSVVFDFVSNTLTVTRTGVDYSTQLENNYSPISMALSSDFSLSTGTHAIDILVSNTRPQSGGGFDAMAASTMGEDAFYRIDNFQVIAAQIPESSSALLGSLGLLLVFRRRRS